MWTTWFWASMFIHQYDSVTIGIEILGRNKQNRIQQIHEFFSKMCISSKMKRIFCCLFLPITFELSVSAQSCQCILTGL